MVGRPVENGEARTVSLLGATGSIGASTLAVLSEKPEGFVVDAVTANRDARGLARIARATGARFAAVADPSAYAQLRDELGGSRIEVAAGPEAIVAAAERPADITVAAIVGSAGLAPTHAALNAGRTIALANKECLVSAGEVFLATAAATGGRLLPVDSEHNAIFQILDGRDRDGVERVVLTASGGPFLRRSADQIAAAGPDDAVRHPRWSMGAKISVDSATMMNKGLEIIEAFHLFGLRRNQLDVLVHPESVVHGLVELVDGTVLAAMGVTDMRLPIAFCLAWPGRTMPHAGRLDLAEVGALTFMHLDRDKFPAFDLAMRALDEGGWATNILNAANETAVEAFLARTIPLPGIAGLVSDVLDEAAGEHGLRAPATIGEAIELDRYGRDLARDHISRTAGLG